MKDTKAGRTATSQIIFMLPAGWHQYMFIDSMRGIYLVMLVKLSVSSFGGLAVPRHSLRLALCFTVSGTASDILAYLAASLSALITSTLGSCTAFDTNLAGRRTTLLQESAVRYQQPLERQSAPALLPLGRPKPIGDYLSTTSIPRKRNLPRYGLTHCSRKFAAASLTASYTYLST